nr:MAG TPA: hypothetical protein [Caudoviricetes sp.]
MFVGKIRGYFRERLCVLSVLLVDASSCWLMNVSW